MAINEQQQAVNAGIVRVLGEISETMTNIDESLNSQTDAIQHTPSKGYLNWLTAALLAVVLLAVGVQTRFLYDQQSQTRRVGEQNNQTVAIYCGAQPELTECTSSGSATSKASAILASCRIYENLIAATPPERRVPVKTDAACKALGFEPQG